MDRRVIGSCGKAHGLRGEVAVYTEVPEVFVAGTSLELSGGAVVTVVATRPHQNHLLVAFQQISDRSAAESLRNLELSIDARDLPPLEKDEFWASDLVGREVRDQHGNRLGHVSDVVGSVAQDRLIVTTPGETVAVPFVPEIVTEVASDHVVVDPPDGLFP